MFLMNRPPVAALQSKWEAFGPSGGFRFPGCFSEPTEGAARTAVSTKVQLVIGRLRSDASALGMSHEHVSSRGHRGDPGRGTRPAANPATPRGQPVFSTCMLAAGLNPPVEAAGAASDPLALDSDSDDSVDRGIEEAIQEYRKARSGSRQPMPGGTLPPRAPEGGSRCKPEPSPNSATTPLCPAKPRGGTVAAGGGPRGGGTRGPASPGSVSSEDSFEQSIQTEIEQFLSEKKQLSTQKADVPADRKPEPSGPAARLASPSSTEPATRVLHPDDPGAGKEFLFRKQKASGQPRGPPSSTRAAAPRPAAPGRPPETAQHKVGARRGTGAGRRGRRAKSTALLPRASDSSSSDDGIETAIQLYQLEKTHREVGSGDVPHRAPPREGKGPGPVASSTTWNASPEPLRRKKKLSTTKTTELGPAAPESSRPTRPSKESTGGPPPGGTATRCELPERTMGRADTSTELLCAEAILDISATVLPAPDGASNRALPSSRPFHVPHAPAHSDGDSGSVDSDDSIEQEIQTFLALKAQSGSLLARAEGPPPHAWSPGPNGQAGSPRALPTTAPVTSMNCKRKCRGGGRTPKSSVPRKSQESIQDADHSQVCVPGQGRAGEALAREETEASSPPLLSKVAGCANGLIAPDGKNGLPPGPGKVDEARGAAPKRGSGDDKSSSLDSDEDLDTAIKDLLRSKRKLKRRNREPRGPTSRKRVRFSTAETQSLEMLGNGRRDWRDPSPGALRSCLAKSKRGGGEGTVAAARRAGASGGDTPRKRAPGVGLCCDGTEAPHRAAATPLPDDSSSVDSDDSIEQEIRKFLAEKAKESVGCADSQGSPLPLQAGGLPGAGTLGRREPAPSLCTWSQRPQAASQLTEGPKSTERATGVPNAARVFGQGAPGLAATLDPSEQVLPKASPGAFSAKGAPATRRHTHSSKELSTRGAEPTTATAAEGALGQLPASAKAGMEAQSASTFSGSLLSPWPEREGQGGLRSTWALAPDVTWKGVLGTEREGSTGGLAKCPTALPFSGFAPLLSTQLFHFGKSVSWGGMQANLFSSPLGLPLQGPSFSAFRQAPLAPSPGFGSSHLLTKKEACQWPNRKSPAGLGLPDRRTSGSEENTVDLRYRRRAIEGDDEDQEAPGSDASEFSDASLEDGGSGVPGRALQL
ncbi:protein phosphatase 1 regulatory subunit 26 isoform X2 [Echinops telfairi]|nr:protein phosphatase 1 regulatory subunit 26 isoform X2 [Echinops telfairi]XP_045145164.1 protein phosphatase 1 regulatory subunit 26 isoform X2 [Echinops telfairi]